MDEPSRIGLTKEANILLEEMLKAIDPGKKLIKFDLYRLAVALGIKKGISPMTVPSQIEGNLRVSELDENKALFIAVDSLGICNEGQSVYRCIEALADQGIRDFYHIYRNNVGKIPWEQLLGE